MSDKKSLWRGKYKSLEEYYLNTYPSEYFSFDKYQLTIDPDETIDDFNAYDAERQFIEDKKCISSFPYFAQKYARILHPKKGLVPFILFNYQKRSVKDFEENRWNIISKFRQGGLTTLVEIWSFWRCLYKMDQQILFISKTDQEAIAAGDILNRLKQNLPNWMQPNTNGKWNDHLKQFIDTGGQIKFGTPERARGSAATLLIVDEAAFIPDMQDHWKAIYPVLSTGGSAIIISTVNGIGNWYEEEYHKAQQGKNKFKIIDLDYWEHPDYNNPVWVEEQKAQLGERGWKQEVLRSFLDSGETYIPASIIVSLQQRTRNNYPKMRKFAKYVNKGENQSPEEWENNGALWVWKEPVDGHDYILSIDTAEGVGEEGDNSCIEVIDANTLEQVAEYYSNNTPPYILSQIGNQLASLYNHAIIVVENVGCGASVVNNLQHELHYDNLYYENIGKSGRTAKAGLKINGSNRPVILECLQRRVMNETIIINSNRFVKELNTFVYNRKTERPEASNGNHDDAIMAMALAIYIRDTLLRDLPLVGEAVFKEETKANNTQIYEEVKKEILECSTKEFFDEFKENDILDFGTEEQQIGIVYNIKRPFSKLLSEFGW